MLGTDIVQLRQLRQDRWSRRIDKICSKEEQKWLGHMPQPFLAFAQLWALKEAAYKLGLRLGAPLGYYPKKITVEELELGYFFCSAWSIYLQLEMAEDYIWAQAAPSRSDLARIQANIYYWPQWAEQPRQRSSALRQLIGQNLGLGQLIKDEKGLPFWKEEAGPKIPLSLSYDGPWASWAKVSPSVAHNF
ncbi:4'-phosphopantetheinyl transferase superfamily protein [Saprospira sp. CCB-QB6]|uniref:4'-phosphopantetheinyl transferase family protein n=1 Tax=Saprospira sp. CCB-QB6 TaxID=3023936 RepID=UPI0023495B8F|nr:4'-phosphopantetheinyl transferase superfamily protein [Saprospira sp. CCB-QB6]WCL81472.1 4'-phosphopantetheinyl transferase superfamily protein [Saprospira sp. CCB-QB6]